MSHTMGRTATSRMMTNQIPSQGRHKSSLRTPPIRSPKVRLNHNPKAHQRDTKVPMLLKCRRRSCPREVELERHRKSSSSQFKPPRGPAGTANLHSRDTTCVTQVCGGDSPCAPFQSSCRQSRKARTFLWPPITVGVDWSSGIVTVTQ
jgi:hypothetical protein